MLGTWLAGIRYYVRMNGCGKWEMTGNWPVQSKWNYPKLNFIPFDMKHQFGDTEICGIWRENIVYIIVNANHNTFKGQLRAKFCLPQCCQWCPRLLPTNVCCYRWSLFETRSEICLAERQSKLH